MFNIYTSLIAQGRGAMCALRKYTDMYVTRLSDPDNITNLLKLTKQGHKAPMQAQCIKSLCGQSVNDNVGFKSPISKSNKTDSYVTLTRDDFYQGNSNKTIEASVRNICGQ